MALRELLLINRTRMNEFIVRQATTEDIEKLKVFYEKAFGNKSKYKYPERWQWHYKQYDLCEENKLPLFIAINEQGNIIGHTAASNVAFKLYDSTYRLSWSVDTIVFPEHRGKGIGIKLQKINQDNAEIFASLSMSEANRQIKIKLGARKGPVSEVLIKKIAFEKNFTSLLVSLIQKSNKKGHIKSNFIIDEPQNAVFGNEESVLWEKLRLDYDLAVERNAPYLNWRYKDQPFTQHLCIRAYNKEHELTGLTIYRITEEATPKGAIILEILCKTDDISLIQSMILRTEDHLKLQGINQIMVASSNIKTINTLKNLGYIKIDENGLIIYTNKNAAANINKDTKALLTLGDQDWDEFPNIKIFSCFKILEVLLYLNNFKDVKNVVLRLLLKLYMKTLAYRNK